MSGHANVGRPYELRFELRFALFEQHFDDLAQVCDWTFDLVFQRLKR